MYKKLKKSIVVGIAALSILSYANPVNANDTIDEELSEYFSKEHRLLDREKIELSSLAKEFNKRFNIEVRKDGIEQGFGYFDLSPDKYRPDNTTNNAYSLFEYETNKLIQKRIEGAASKSIEDYIRRTDLFLRLKQYYEGLTKLNIFKGKEGPSKVELPSLNRKLNERDLEREYIERELKRIKGGDFVFSLYDRKREIELEAKLDELNKDEMKRLRYRFRSGTDFSLDSDLGDIRDFNLRIEPFAELRTSIVDATISYPFSIKSDKLNVDNTKDEFKIKINKTITTSFGSITLNAEDRYRIEDTVNITNLSINARLTEFDFRIGYQRDWKSKEDIFAISGAYFITDKINLELRSNVNTKGDYSILGLLNFNVRPEYFFRNLNDRLRLNK